MRNTLSVLKNQKNELIADKEQIILFVMFPALAFIQARVLELDYGIYPYQIVSMIGLMFALSGFVMMMPQVIAEHRENGSLRFMVMSGIKPHSYLLGLGGFYFILGMITTGVFAVIGEMSADVLINFTVVMALGIICSVILASIIGILSKNRQKAMGYAFPIGFIIMFLPMFADMLEPLAPILDLTFINRLSYLLMSGNLTDSINHVVVILINIAVLLTIFTGLFKVKGLKK